MLRLLWIGDLFKFITRFTACKCGVIDWIGSMGGLNCLRAEATDRALIPTTGGGASISKMLAVTTARAYVDNFFLEGYYNLPVTNKCLTVVWELIKSRG